MIIFKNDPVKIFALGSRFGPRVRNGNTFHNGLDFKIKSDTPLLAVDDGTVVVSRVHPKGISAGMGIYIVIQHNGFCTVYGHLKKLGLPVGTKVKAGQIIAYSGNTGDSTGPHLHFEVRQGKFDVTFWNQIDGKYPNAVDPSLYLINQELIEELVSKAALILKINNQSYWVDVIKGKKQPKPEYIKQLFINVCK